MIVLSKQQILKIHYQLIKDSGGESGIRDENMLDSALNSPFQTFDNKDLYSSIESKAARLGYGLIKNHPFNDGNKRTGVHIMLVFLALNGVELEYAQKELYEIIMKVASGECDFQDLLEWVYIKSSK